MAISLTYICGIPIFIRYVESVLYNIIKNFARVLIRYSHIFLISQSGTKRTVRVNSLTRPEYQIARVAQIEPKNIIPFY